MSFPVIFKLDLQSGTPFAPLHVYRDTAVSIHVVNCCELCMIDQVYFLPRQYSKIHPCTCNTCVDMSVLKGFKWIA